MRYKFAALCFFFVFYAFFESIVGIPGELCERVGCEKTREGGYSHVNFLDLLVIPSLFFHLSSFKHALQPIRRPLSPTSSCRLPSPPGPSPGQVFTTISPVCTFRSSKGPSVKPPRLISSLLYLLTTGNGASVLLTH